MCVEFSRRHVIASFTTLFAAGCVSPRFGSSSPYTRTVSPRTIFYGTQGGEGPCTLPDGRIAFVEILKGTINAVTRSGQTEVLASPGKGVAGLTVGSGNVYAAKMRFPMRPCEGPDCTGQPDSPLAGILRLNLATRKLEPIITNENGYTFTGPNDLVIDRHGDLWFTDFMKGALWWCRADGMAAKEVIPDCPAANGIALAPDGTRLRIALNRDRRILDVPITGQGTIGATRTLGGGSAIDALGPQLQYDGLKVAQDGTILAAGWQFGILAFTPEGRYLGRTVLPDMSVINFCLVDDESTVIATVNPLGSPPSSLIGSIVTFPWPATASAG